MTNTNILTKSNTTTVGAMTSLGLGFLLALSLSSIWSFVHEQGISLYSVVIALTALSVSAIIGSTLAKHLSVCTHDHVDSASDKTFIVLLVLGSLIHTAFDGLIVHEAFDESSAEGLIVLFSILAHEVVRTTILFKVLRIMHFKKILSMSIVFGISALGILGGFLGSAFLEGLHAYESWIGLGTGALFFIVAVDLFYFIRHHHKQTSLWWSLLGVVLFFGMETFIGHGHE